LLCFVINIVESHLQKYLIYMNTTSIALAFIGGLAITGSTILVSAPVYAQSVSITVSPMVTIAPVKGAQSRASFSVTNNGQTPIRTRIYAQDFDYDIQKGYTKTGTHANSANPYLQFSPKELVIAPGVTREIRLNITIPPSKPDGEYRVAVFTEDLTERKITDPKSKQITVIRPQIGSIFFVSKGNISSQLSAVSVGWNPETSKPRLVLKNQGQKSAYSEVNWKLKQGNTEIASHSIQGIVLQAGHDRAIDLKISTETKLAPGAYTLTGDIDNKDGKTVPFSLNVNIPAK
jgi:hypothetical protein